VTGQAGEPGDAIGPPVPRPAARVLLVDPAGRVLLVRFVVPETGYAWWAAPGGGLLAGEGHEQAARREVFEETGLPDVRLGPCVWVREHVFPWRGRRYRQQERFFLARVDAFEPRWEGPTAEEAEMLPEHRWWTPAEIDRSPERFAPRRLGGLLRRLLAEGPPPLPLDVGI
jgi:8-oxo-dGTP pyrophosphatase MutT (NUDIX family)